MAHERTWGARLVPSWQLESLLWGISSGFSLVNHFGLPGSLPIFSISQDPPMCAHASLNKDGSDLKGLWVERPLTQLPFGLQGAFLCMCDWEGLLTSGKRLMWSGQGLAFSRNCLASLILEFRTTACESPTALPWGDPSTACRTPTEPEKGGGVDGVSRLPVWPLRGSTVDSLFTCVPSTGNSKGRGGSTDLCLMELMVEGERETSNKKT